MRFHSIIEEGVKLGLEILVETRVKVLRKIGQVLALSLDGYGRAGNKLLQRIEETVERTVHPVYLRLAY